jgi:hypothetical protein
LRPLDEDYESDAATVAALAALDDLRAVQPTPT